MSCSSIRPRTVRFWFSTHYKYVFCIHCTLLKIRKSCSVHRFWFHLNQYSIQMLSCAFHECTYRYSSSTRNIPPLTVHIVFHDPRSAQTCSPDSLTEILWERGREQERGKGYRRGNRRERSRGSKGREGETMYFRDLLTKF